MSQVWTLKVKGLTQTFWVTVMARTAPSTWWIRSAAPVCTMGPTRSPQLAQLSPSVTIGLVGRCRRARVSDSELVGAASTRMPAAVGVTV